MTNKNQEKKNIITISDDEYMNDRLLSLKNKRDLIINENKIRFILLFMILMYLFIIVVLMFFTSEEINFDNISSTIALFLSLISLVINIKKDYSKIDDEIIDIQKNKRNKLTQEDKNLYDTILKSKRK